MSIVKSIVLVLALFSLLTACATPKSSARFYTLTDSHAAKNTADVTGGQTTTAPLAIEVLPINVPERFKRPQLVISASNPTQLKILEQDRWSSSFNDELQDAFVSGISHQLNAVDISRGGRITSQPTYRIAIVLQQFNATPGEQVQANFGWTINLLKPGQHTDNAGVTTDERAISCQASFSKNIGSDIDSVVKATQESVADVIQKISANIDSFQHNQQAVCR